MRRSVKRPNAPLFLPRPDYKVRRLVDVARLLPVFGGFLWLMPILWGPGQSEARDTAPDGMYLFAAWAVLIAVAALLAPGLADAADDGATHRNDEPGADSKQDDS